MGPFHDERNSMQNFRTRFSRRLRQSSLRAFALILMLSFIPSAPAQNITGFISGSVTDPAGAAVPEAKVTLVNTATAGAVSAMTSASGDFVFSSLQAGTYSVTAEKGGFRTVQRTEIVLSAGERRSLGQIALQLGAVQET